MVIFLYVISIIWWIFCIILSIKVWGMCDDVRKIKNQIGRNDDYSTSIDFLLRIGEKEKAKEILINRILSNEAIFNSTSTPVEKIDDICQIYKDELETLEIQVTKEQKFPNALIMRNYSIKRTVIPHFSFLTLRFLAAVDDAAAGLVGGEDEELGDLDVFWGAYGEGNTVVSK